jgi:hypothetical protein
MGKNLVGLIMIKLKVGQVWLPYSSDDYTLKILDIAEGEVEIEQIETRKIYTHELDGSDGFVDFLEENLYTLKK